MKIWCISTLYSQTRANTVLTVKIWCVIDFPALNPAWCSPVTLLVYISFKVYCWVPWLLFCIMCVKIIFLYNSDILICRSCFIYWVCDVCFPLCMHFPFYSYNFYLNYAGYLLVAVILSRRVRKGCYLCLVLYCFSLIALLFMSNITGGSLSISCSSLFDLYVRYRVKYYFQLLSLL
jgi:hypothetical protein